MASISLLFDRLHDAPNLNLQLSKTTRGHPLEVRMKCKILTAVPLTLLLGACATWGPTWSEMTGQIYSLPTPNQNVAPAAIQNIDGNGAFPDAPGAPIKVTPGKHTVVLAAIPLSAGWTGGTGLVTTEIEVAPCERVYINAQYDTRLGTQWKPFMGHQEMIAGCQVPTTKK